MPLLVCSFLFSFFLFFFVTKQKPIADYQQLWKWSVDYPELFWSEVWDYTQVVASKKGEHVINKDVLMDDIPVWFEESRLNFAENLLWCRDAKKTAIIATGSWHYNP